MAGLFSNAGTQLAEAIGNLSNSMFKFGINIYEKLDEAEATTQFEAGQQTLSKSMDDFDAQLAENPDPSTYNELAQKAQDKAWKDVLPTVKNSRASKALSAWWNEQTIRHTKEVSDRATKVKMENTASQADQILNTYVEQATFDNVQDMKDKISAATEGYKDTRIWLPGEADAKKASAIQKINNNLLAKAAHQIAFSKDGDPVDNLKDAIDAVYADKDFPVSEEEKDKIVKNLKTEHSEQLALAKEKIDDENAAIRDQATQDIINGKLGPTGIAKLKFQGKTAGPEMQSLTTFWENLHRDQNANNPGYGYAITYDKLADDTLNVTQKNQIAAEAYSSGYINKGQLDHLMTEISSGISKAKAQGLTYLNEGSKGTDSTPALYSQDDALKATNMLEEALSIKGADASPQYVQQQAAAIKKLFSDKAIRQAIDDQFVMEKKPLGGGGLWQDLGITLKAGAPIEQDLSSVLHGLNAGEFAGTMGTAETRSIITGMLTQLQKLVASKYKVDPKSLSATFDDQGNVVFSTAKGKVTVKEKDSKLSFEGSL